MHDAVGDEALDVAVGPGQAFTPPRWALTTFFVLTAMNLLNYTDRWVLSAVLPQLRADLRLDSTQGGWLATWFLISYTLISPLTGYAGDRFRRTRLLALGTVVWSLATVACGLSRSYFQLSVARAFLGVGEAAFCVIAPTLLTDLYRRETRSQVLSWFYVAMPLGAALGLALGGWIGAHYGWHAAFFLVGAPGLLAAAAVWFLPEPVRGLSEGVDVAKLQAHERVGASREDYVDLMVNSSYTYSVLGMAFYTFAIGGLALWLPTFLTDTKGIEPVRANALLGAVTFGAAVSGMSLGGWLADRLARANPGALFVVPGVALILSVPFTLVAIYSTTEPYIYGGIFLAEALMFVNTGPCNAVIANVVAPNMRSAAYAVATFALHVLGDVWSPPLMGWVADTFGQPDAMESAFGRLLASIHAVPTVRPGHPPENLTAGLLVTVPALLLAGGVLLVGARHVRGEMALMVAKLKASPRAGATPSRDRV